MVRTGRPPKGGFTVQFGIRLDAPLVARLQALEEKLKEEAPWAHPTRADALRAAVVAGLNALGVPDAPAAGRPKSRP